MYFFSVSRDGMQVVMPMETIQEESRRPGSSPYTLSASRPASPFSTPGHTRRLHQNLMSGVHSQLSLSRSTLDVIKVNSLSSSFPFIRCEVLAATFSPPRLIVFSTLLCLLSSSSSLPPLLPSSHLISISMRAIVKLLIATFIINMVLHLHIYTFMHTLYCIYVSIKNAVCISNVVNYNNVY